MKIQLSEHFTYKKLIKFTIPTIIMMLFTSIYGIVDGIFISNCVGSEAFAAVNLIMPVLMILGAIGFMIGTGRKCNCFKNTRRRKKRTSQQILFNVNIFTNYIWSNTNNNWDNFYGTTCKNVGSRRRNAFKLCNIWKNYTDSINSVSFAKLFSKFFSSC